MGNDNAKKVYEAKLPKGFKRPNESNGYELEQFIRAKYEKKAYFSQDAYERVMNVFIVYYLLFFFFFS